MRFRQFRNEEFLRLRSEWYATNSNAPLDETESYLRIGRKKYDRRKNILPKAGRRNIIVFEIMEIMSSHLSLASKISGFLFGGLLLSGPSVFGADLLLQRVPSAPASRASIVGENLARFSLGAQIEVSPQTSSITGLQLSSKSDDRNTAEGALLCDDPTVGYALPNGASTVLISFPMIENVESLSFLNRDAKGNVSIATSSAKLPSDSPQWHEVARQEIDGSVVKARIGPVEAKYVRLTFDLKGSGRIAGLGIFATPAGSNFNRQRLHKVSFQSEGTALIGRSLTNLHYKSRVLYVTSGEDFSQANNMIDNYPATTFSFATNDDSPCAIIDLGRIASIRRISAVYSQREGKIDFFVLQSLPGTESANHGLIVDGMALARLIPVGSVNDGSSGRTAIDFPVTAGRYIMVKWMPATHDGTPFSIAEVAAFGGTEIASLIAANTTRTRSAEISSDETDGKDYDAKDFAEGKDFKEAKEAPPEAPGEGPTSPLPAPPPFTFIPVVGPVSP
jgi:hypothetical protein